MVHGPGGAALQSPRASVSCILVTAFCCLAGTGVGMIVEELHAADILQKLVRDANTALAAVAC